MNLLTYCLWQKMLSFQWPFCNIMPTDCVGKKISRKNHKAKFAICTSDVITFPTLQNKYAYLLSVARNAMISAAILQHNADRLCDEEHLVFTRWPFVFLTTEGSSESEKNHIWKKTRHNSLIIHYSFILDYKIHKLYTVPTQV